MQRNFGFALDHVLAHEGGFANHPADPGGATMKGVTLRVFRSVFGADRSVEDLKAITRAQLERIYREGYWDRTRADDLPSGVDLAVFDSAVNSGPGRGASWLQAAVGAVVDGGIGPQTLARVAAMEPARIVAALLDRRLGFLRGLSTFPVFGRGWTRRVASVRAAALELAHRDAAPVALALLRLGSRGEWVRRVQARLGIAADGDFGPLTEAAVRSFQRAGGLSVDGIVGEDTYRALGLIP